MLRPGCFNLHIFLLSAAILIADQITKSLVMRSMTLNQSISIIPNFFGLTYVHNYGAAFGLFAHRTGFFILIAVAVVIFILVFMVRIPGEHTLMRVALALQLGGALGNLMDRLRFGYVVDFMELRYLPIFNIADMAIVFGIGLLVIDLLRSPREKGI